MEPFNSINTLPFWAILLGIVVIFWDLFWKAWGLWRSARNGNAIWFVLMLVLNTAGILPIIYLITHGNNRVR